VELYPHFYSQIRLHIVVLNKEQAEHQLHRALSGGTENSRSVIWTGKMLLAQRHDEKREQLEDQGVDRIILKQIYKKSGGTVSNGLIWYSNIRGISNKMQLLHSLFIPGNCSTCFGCYFHPSSGAHTTVSTASGICHTVMDRVKLLIKCI
jgi:hypothetical protein